MIPALSVKLSFFCCQGSTFSLEPVRRNLIFFQRNRNGMCRLLFGFYCSSLAVPICYLEFLVGKTKVKGILCRFCLQFEETALTFHCNLTVTSSYPGRNQLKISAILKSNQQAKIMRRMAAKLKRKNQIKIKRNK